MEQLVLVIIPVAITTVPVSLDSQRKDIGVYVLLVSLVNIVRMTSMSAKKEPTIAVLMRFVITPKDPTTAHVNQDMKGTEIIAQLQRARTFMTGLWPKKIQPICWMLGLQRFPYTVT
ncbi:hypothetical protein ABFA07_000115 [Porites harrisoni]